MTTATSGDQAAGSTQAAGGAGVSLRPGGVSLRPGGGGLSFRPGGGGPSKGSGFAAPAHRPQGARGSELGASPAEARAPGSTERYRYTRAELLELQQLWQSVPKEVEAEAPEIIAGPNDGLGSLVSFDRTSDDWGANKASKAQPAAPPPAGSRAAKAGGSPERDWKARTPLPPPPQQERSEFSGKDGGNNKGGGKNNGGGAGRGGGRENIRSVVQQPVHEGPAPAIVKAANPWKPTRGNEDQAAKVYKTVKGILNKLTPEKFETLFEQLLQAGISSAELLRGVISLVFEKAVLEPTFCPMYAELCKRLSEKLPEFPAPEGEEKPVTFRRVLLNTCQEEFEGSAQLRQDLKGIQGEEREAEREEAEKKLKMRTLGNIRLIGELFKQKIIPEKIVHACMQDLLGDAKTDPLEENVEALCQLLRTVGKQLEESVKGKAFMEKYFQNLKSFSNNKNLVSRMRFMVRDLIDLRENKWVPRREELKVTTLDKVHEEAAARLGVMPGMARALTGRAGRGGGAAPLFPPGPPMPGAPGAPNGRLPGKPLGMSALDDGWETVGVGRKGTRPPTPIMPGGPVPVGVPGPRPVVAQPPASANCGAKPSAPPLSRNLPAPQRPVFMGPARPNPTATPPAAPPATKPSPPPPAAAPAAAAAPAGKDAAARIDSLLKEYLSSADVKEAGLCVRELKDAAQHSKVVEAGVMLGFDLKDRDRELLSKLFAGLVKDSVIFQSELAAGFEVVGESMDDFVYDLPLAPAYLGGFVGRAIVGAVAGLQELQQVCEKMEDVLNRRKVAIAALNVLKGAQGEEALAKSVESAGSLAAYLDGPGEKPLAEALKSAGLGFLA